MPLIAAANRDEFYDRPTAPAAWWGDHREVYAGRDLKSGGTWMGITKDGRFAAITNVRNPADHRDDAPSRGILVSNYLTGKSSAQEYIAEIAPHAADYNGFNLLIGDRSTLAWYSNKAIDDARNGKPLAPGVYGISNGGLDTCWPKVVRAKAQFASLLCQCAPEEAFFDMLADTTRASDCRLPKTGVSMEMERVLSSVCIESPNYGTRVSTVVKLDDANNAVLYERQVK
jgi:uncharacterized protein with NRDE domain